MGWIVPLFLALMALVYVISAMKSLIVATGTTALIYRNGKFERELAPGRHRWFDPTKATSTHVVPRTRMVLAGHDVTVMTSDQFSFRLVLTPICEIEDSRAWHEAQPPVGSPAYGYQQQFPELQPTLNAATIAYVARRTLEEFLAEPAAILPDISARVQNAMPGARLLDLLITSITMPPEVRKMFTEIERAKREALASLERARGEQASLRALANAARSLRSNPELAHLRMLQTVEGAKGNKTIILGQAAFPLTGAPTSEKR